MIWLPASLLQAAQMQYHETSECQPIMAQSSAQHAVHAMPEQACQIGGQGDCHGCDLCSLSLVPTPAVPGFHLPSATQFTLPGLARVPAYFPEQPERPPRV